MKFDPAIVEPLEYDLSTWRPDPDAPGLEESERERRLKLAAEPWTGVIPEPADDKVTRFLQGVMPDIAMEQSERSAEVIQTITDRRRAWWAENRPDGADDLTDDQLNDNANMPNYPMSLQRQEQADYSEATVKAREEARRRTITELADFCSQQPSEAVLGELPWRALQHFLGYVTGQFRPEALAAAMRA